MKQSFLAVVTVVLIAGCLDSWPQVPPVVFMYEVDVEDPTSVDAATMTKLVSSVDRRVNPHRARHVEVRQFDDRRIEVLIHGGSPKMVREVEQLLSRTGTLEFRILANRHDHEDIIEQAEKDSGDRVLDDRGDLLAWWVRAGKGQESCLAEDEDVIVRRKTSKNGTEYLEVLVVKDVYDVTGVYLADAHRSVDERGKYCVRAGFNRTGGRLLESLTYENRPDETKSFYRRLGIILDGKLHSAPIIRAVFGAYCEITGDFSKAETQEIVDVLNSGSLALPIKRIR